MVALHRGLIFTHVGWRLCAHSHCPMKSLCKTVGFQGFQFVARPRIGVYVCGCVSKHMHCGA